MKKILLILTAAILMVSVVSANPYSFNLYDLPDFNNNTAFVNSSANWVTKSLGPLDDVSAQFKTMGDKTLYIDPDYLDANWLALDGSNSPTADISWGGQNLLMGGGDYDAGGGDIYRVDTINTTGRVYIKLSDSDVQTSALDIRNNNTFGLASEIFTNAEGDELIMAVFGQSISQILFPNITAVGKATMGITGRGGPIIITSQNNDSIFFGGTPDEDITKTDFFMKLDPITQSIILQGDKSIGPKRADGGFALVFDSEDVLEAGGFPFAFEAQDSNNETIMLSWMQNGANNSFSGNMNSYGTVPKSWIQATNPTGETNNITFLFNTSNYPQYCDYLQNNLSLIPEGCQYFADTSGRLVPLLFGGDLEIHRTATVHEGATFFNALDFIGRNGNDVNMLFNGGLENGKLHIRDKRQILANITEFNNVVCDFDDATLCDFYSTSIAPETGRDWDSVLETECHQDRCANAKGGNLKSMCVDSVTLGATNINVSFWLTTVFNVGDSLDITLDDNQGNTTTIFTETVSVDDTLNTFTLPTEYENKLNVTTCFEFDGANVVREVWVDVITIKATLDPAVEINDSFDGGKIVLGEDRDSLSCLIEADKRINNDTLSPEWVMNIGSAGCAVNIAGNVTFEDSTVTNQTVIGDQLITGDLTVEGNTTSSYYFGDGSQLTGINGDNSSWNESYANTLYRAFDNNSFYSNVTLNTWNLNNVTGVYGEQTLVVPDNDAVRMSLWDKATLVVTFDNDTTDDKNGYVATEINTAPIFNTTNFIFGRSTTWDGGRGASSKALNYTNAVTGTTNFSMSYWAYPTDTSAGSLRMYIMGNWLSNTGWQSAVNTASGGQLYFISGGTQDATSAVLVEDTWVHIAGNYDADAGSFQYYINGVAQPLDGSVAPVVAAGAGFFLGSRNDEDFEFIGELDEVYIFDNTINETEIDWLYNGGSGRQLDAVGGGSTTQITSQPLIVENDTDLSVGSSFFILDLFGSVVNVFSNLFVEGNLTVDGDMLINGRDSNPIEQITISGGVINISQNMIAVDTEGAGATDDLTTINGGLEGQIIIVKSTLAGRTVVLKDGTGNLRISGDMTLDHQQDTITLMQLSGAGNWVEISRSNNA